MVSRSTLLTQEIALRVRRTKSVPWGGTLPLDRKLLHARRLLHPSVYVLHDTTRQVVGRMARELETTLCKLVPRSHVVRTLSRATDVVILLTRHILDKDSESLKEMLKVTSEMEAATLTFVYLKVGESRGTGRYPQRLRLMMRLENQNCRLQSVVVRLISGEARMYLMSIMRS